MSKLQRIRNIIVAVLMIAVALVLIIEPVLGYHVVLLILAITLIAEGVRSLIYYLAMARHMVGGGVIFIKGVLILDLGLFTLSLTDIPHRYVMIYLLLYYVFMGVIDILRAFEARKLHAPHWKRKFIFGTFMIIIAIVGMVFSSSVTIVVLIYSAGLIYSAVNRLISAFRRTAVPFIP